MFTGESFTEDEWGTILYGLSLFEVVAQSDDPKVKEAKELAEKIEEMLYP